MDKPIFVFPGIGAQWAGMGRALLLEDSSFAKTVAQFDKLFVANGNVSVLELFQNCENDYADRSECSHLLTFTYQVALTQALAERGIIPCAVIGHSSGEVAAAYCAGILSDVDAARLVTAHCQLIETVNRQGAMLFSAIPHELAEELVTSHAGVEIAAFNSHASVVFTGEVLTLDVLARQLQAENYFCRPLRASIAFHSVSLDPHLETFHTSIDNLLSGTASCTYYSALTGNRFDGPWDATYWRKHIREPVLFSQSLRQLLKTAGPATFIEISPHPALGLGLRADMIHVGARARIIDFMEKGCDEAAQLEKLVEKIDGMETGHRDEKLTVSRDPEKILLEELAILCGEPKVLARQTTWFDLGITSLQVLRLANNLGARLGISITPDFFFRNPLVANFKAALHTTEVKLKPLKKIPDHHHQKVAVIGMAFRFPPSLTTAEDLTDFLYGGSNAISRTPGQRPWLQGEQAGYLCDDIWAFDAAYFNISAGEAQALDPQQRMLLEVSTHALENALIAPGSLRGANVGVYLGISTDDFKELSYNWSADSPYSATGNMFSTASGRLSYFHDFRGPAVSIDTACSSSLVALHQASRALQNGDCELALAGGVNLILSPRLFDVMRSLGALSPTGSCKSFSQDADGYARGEGCALLVLKRLDDAIAAKDLILATICGSAVNQDGRSNGLTAPSGTAQRDLVNQALADSGWGVNDISLIETHGTGTPLGDPIEVAALAEVFADRNPELPPVVLGALKSQLGHLEACSGVAGVVKTIIALNAGKAPAICHLTHPTEHIDWQHIPLQAAMSTTPLVGRTKLVAGVSSFGFSGTNAHIVLEQPPVRTAANRPARELQPFFLNISAKSEHSLRQIAQTYQVRLAAGTLICDASLSLSQLLSRDQHPYRMSVVTDDRDTLLKQLDGAARGEGIRRIPEDPGKIAMLLPGQGTQYVDMGRELYDVYTEFRVAVDQCEEICATQGFPFLSTLYPHGCESESRIDDSPYAQLSYLAFAWGAFNLWKSWGVEPDLLIGNSLGEYVAAALSGAMSLEDAVRLIIKRGELTSSLPIQGRMATIFSDRATVTQYLQDAPELDIAVINGPNNIVVAGAELPLKNFLQRLLTDGIESKLLAIHFASHSRLIEPILDSFKTFCNTIDYRPTSIPVLTNLTGETFAADETFCADYWQGHLRNPVNFARCLESALQHGIKTFIEIGPSSAMNSIVRTQVEPSAATLLQTASRTQPGLQVILASLKGLYLKGLTVDWLKVFAPFSVQRISLPNYSFDHQYQHLPDELSAMQKDNGLSQRIESLTSPVKTEKPHTQKFLQELLEIVQKVTWREPGDINPASNLFELGFDSLMLIQIKQQVEKNFNISLKMGQFYEELDSLEKIAAYLASMTPSREVEAVPLGPFAAPGKLSLQSIVGASDQETLATLFNNQLETMSKLINRQLDTLAGMQLEGQTEGGNQKPPKDENQPKFNFRSMRLSEDQLTAAQLDFVRAFAEEYNQKTAGSKSQAARYRHQLADWINSLGYKQSLKELVYPIVADSSDGAYFFDVDGNKYVDIAMGYGVSFLGHRPPAVIKAIQAQLARGLELGPQSRLAGEVAALVCELTGMERVAFCNTGSEAVMVAIRLARAVTGRKKIVIFSNSYHGTFDSVLATQMDGQTYPTASGIPPKMVEDVIVLSYAGEEALEKISNHSRTIAAVLVEPVQSRNPGLVPVDFVRQLRELTRQEEIALIFDETITGFRMHPGGAQALFNVRADIAIYGKSVGGGMPMSLVAGEARYLNAIDGGTWSYGDDSHPSDEVTFFGGTYVKHPLALAAAKATLTTIKQRGTALQEQISTLMSDLRQRANSYFTAEDVPIRLIAYGSMFRFEGLGRNGLLLDPLEMDLFFYLLINQGVYTWERRICFLSAAHTQDDIEMIYVAIQKSVRRLREGGFTFCLNHDSNSVPGSKTSNGLASSQLRLLVFDQLSEEKTLYNLPLAFLLVKQPDRQQIAIAINKVIKHHPALSASFSIDENGPRQDFHPNRLLQLERIENKGLTVDQIIDSFVRPFDLAKDLLLRAAICEFTEERWLLLFDFHHIVADGLALNSFLCDLSDLLSNDVTCHEYPHYSDYIVAETAYRSSESYVNDERFWMEQFSELTPSLTLPSNESRPEVQNYQGDNVFFSIATEQTKAIKNLAVESRTSLFSLMLAAYAAFLQQLTGAVGYTIGVPVDARPEGFEPVVGMFANTLPLPIAVQPKDSFQDLAKQVQRGFLQAFEHQRYPLEDLIRKLQVPRDLGRNPLFDTMFIYENGQDRVFDLSGQKCVPWQYNKKTAMFDLTLEVVDAEGVLHCRLEYATALFQRATVEQFSRRFTTLLEIIIDNPGILIGEIDLLEPEEKQRLSEVNCTEHPFPEDETITAVWAERVSKYPDSVALVCDGRERTCGWLDETANRIARVINEVISPQPDDRVAFLMERSELAIAALLGILKSGSAYVPISPEFPVDRRNAILEASGARALVTSTQQNGDWCQQCGLPVIVADGILGPDSAFHDNPRLEAAHLAYIMFTSGSTGAPKGVMISHRNVISMTENLPHVYGITADDVLLAVTSFTFDISVLEIFSCLLVGTRIILATDDDNLSISPLAELMATHNVSAFQTTPSRLKLMLEMSGPAAIPATLRTLLVGGEAFPSDLFDQLRNASTRVFNVYGPTETTIWSTSALINGKEQPTIGRPLLNEQIYILDPTLRQVAPGVVGELHIGGQGVGRGYLGMDQLTARKFIRTPWSASKTLYATGDLARLRLDGELEFLGRSDDQIKLRGYRIELQEIENHLVAHPAVQQAALKAIKDPTTGEISDLAAYYTLLPEASDLSIDDLREHLNRYLPPYMLPAYFTHLGKMPLNQSGKIDRKELPEPVKISASAVAAQRPPASEKEALLLSIVSGVLGNPEVGIDDNFFSFGGDSVRAILVAARAKDAGLKLEVRQVFEHPTVSLLAACLEHSLVVPQSEASDGAFDYSAQSMQSTQAGVSGYVNPGQGLTLAPLQEGMLFHAMLDENSSAYINQARFTVEVELDPANVTEILQTLTDRHAMLRTRFVAGKTPQPYQLVSQQHLVSCRVEDLADLSPIQQKGRVSELCNTERGLIRVLDNQPPTRILLIRLGERRWDLVWSFHHILLDGWSIAILLREFLALCQGHTLPAKTGDFEQYLMWLDRQDQADAQEFWKGSLDQAPVTALFPSVTAEAGYQAQELSRSIPSPAFQSLKKVAGQFGVTLNSLLLAVWALVVKVQTGQDDVLFGTTVSGRPPELSGVEDMVGLFINTLPTRVQITATDFSLLDLAQTIQVSHLKAVQYQYVNLAQVQAETGQKLFDHLILFENYPLEKGVMEFLDGTGTSSKLSAVRFFEHTHYALEVVIIPHDKLDITFRYNSQQVKDAEVQFLADSLMEIIGKVTSNPVLTIQALVSDLFIAGSSKTTTDNSKTVTPKAALKEFLSPDTGNMEKLARIFCEILGLEKFGVDENFFSSGGHSLKVVRLAGMIWQELELEVSLKLIYANPTPRSLANALTEARTVPCLELKAFPEAADYPLTEGQKGLWLYQQLSKESCAYNTVGSYLLEGELDLQALEDAMLAVTERHESLRTCFSMEQGEPRQIISEQPVCRLERVDLEGAAEPEEMAREAILDRLAEPFLLQKLPLYRATLFHLEANRHILSLIFHHIISDGWSDAILARDISHFYLSAMNGTESKLPPLTLNYRDFAQAQQDFLNHETSAEMRHFWMQALSGIHEQPAFFHDFPRPAKRAGRGARQSFSLGTQAEPLRQLARNCNVTPFVVLQAMVKLLVYAVTGEADQTLGVPSANRSHPDTQNTVGYFLNLLPIRSKLVADAFFNEFVIAVNHSTLQAFEHQDYPFSSMVNDLQLAKSFNRHPVFDIMVIFHNNEPSQFTLGNVECTPFFEESVACRFDIDFEFFDTQQLAGFIEYDCELYRASSIASLISAFTALVKACCESPDAMLEQLAQLSRTELGIDEGALLHEMNMIEDDF